MAAGVRLRRPGDDRRGRPGQGAAHGARSSSTSPNGSARTNPDAWIIDFTNPVGIVTRALLQAGHRAVGLCNVAIGFQRRSPDLLGVAPEQVRLDHVGLNHLTWERGVRLGGRRASDRAARAARRARPTRSPRDLDLPRAVLDRLGVVPSYYLRYFYAHDEVVRELQDQARRGPPRSPRWSSDCWRCTPTRPLDEKPALLAERGGAFYSEAAVALVASLLRGRGRRRARSSTYATTARCRSCPTTPSSRCRRRSAPRAPSPLPVAPVEPAVRRA